MDMSEEDIFAVENGALLDAPVYETHKRGKNWMAVIASDPGSLGGTRREFCKRGNGAYYYIVTPELVGKAVEFGADYYSGSGNKSARRYYGVVLSLTDTEMRIRKYNTGRAACKAAEAQAGPDRAALVAEREKLIARLAEIDKVLGGTNE
jgi:hypothetical protein